MEDNMPEEDNNHSPDVHNQPSSSSGDRKLVFKIKFPKRDSSSPDLRLQQTHDFHQINNPLVPDSSASPVNIIEFEQNDTRIVCPQCNKEFVSGKALGGHMRIHAEAIKKQHQRQKLVFPNQSVLFNRRSSEESVIVNEADYRKTRVLMKKIRPVCSLCGKKFSSMKSLFGHMRCHPEREWRGIKPPNDEDVDAEQVFDVSQPMPQWNVKARRGRKAVNKSVESSGVWSSDDDDDDEEEKEVDEEEEEVDEEELKYRNVVSDLLLLKQLDCSELSGVSLAAASSKRGDGVDHQHQEATNSYSMTINNRGEETHVLHNFLGGGFELLGKKKEMKRSLFNVDGTADDPVMKKCRYEEGRVVGSTDGVIKNFRGSIGVDGNGSGVENQGTVDKSDIGNHEQGEKDNSQNYFDGFKSNEEMVMGSKNKKAKKMKRTTMDLDSSVAPEKYRCSTCNKCFSSHQALGGHRSSHNKFKITIINGDAAATDHQNQSSSVTAAFAASDQVAEHEDHQFQKHQQQVINTLPEVCDVKHTSTDEGGGSSRAAGDNSSGNVHQGRVCGKIFPSGQALGGHKRCHWIAPADQYPATQAQALVVTSSGEESNQTGCRGVRFTGIDLNAPPPMEVDDNAEGGGDGHGWLSL